MKLWAVVFRDKTKIEAYAPTKEAAKELAENGRRLMNRNGVTALDERVLGVNEVKQS